MDQFRLPFPFRSNIIRSSSDYRWFMRLFLPVYVVRWRYRKDYCRCERIFNRIYVFPVFLSIWIGEQLSFWPCASDSTVIFRTHVENVMRVAKRSTFLPSQSSLSLGILSQLRENPLFDIECFDSLVLDKRAFRHRNHLLWKVNQWTAERRFSISPVREKSLFRLWTQKKWHHLRKDKVLSL